MMARIELDPATLDDDALALLLSVIHLCGGRSWPRWAERALTQSPDARARASFKRVLKRAWPGADNETRRALTTVAAALGVEVPQPAKPQARAKPRRTRWPRIPWLPTREGHDRGRLRAHASASAEARERERRLQDLNSAPGVWVPAASFRDALHPDDR